MYITYNYTIYLFDLYFPELFNARPPSLYVFSTPTHFWKKIQGPRLWDNICKYKISEQIYHKNRIKWKSQAFAQNISTVIFSINHAVRKWIFIAIVFLHICKKLTNGFWFLSFHVLFSASQIARQLSDFLDPPMLSGILCCNQTIHHTSHLIKQHNILLPWWWKCKCIIFTVLEGDTQQVIEKPN